MARMGFEENVPKHEQNMEMHEYLWEIPNHDRVVCEPTFLCQAKRDFSITSNSGRKLDFQVGYGLVDKNNYSPYLTLKTPDTDGLLTHIRWSLHCQLPDWTLFEVKLKPTEFHNQVVHHPETKWQLNHRLSSRDPVIWAVRLTLFETPTPTARAFESFFTKTHKENFARLLDDTENADVKIICNDGVEIMAHKIILLYQNPVFAATFSSQMKEQDSRTVTVDDVGSPTMEIILRLLYTGDLDKTWHHSANIVEFVYAAGKYQLTDVLKMLDAELGKFDYGESNVQLLSLTSKLGLPNAEKRLLARVKATVSKVETTDELFRMFD